MALVSLVALAAAGCDGKLLTGPGAQRAVAQAQRSSGRLPPGVVVLVDGVRLPDSVGPNGFLRDRDPSTIDYVRITIDPAVTRLYGPTVGRVYFITTKSASAPFTPLETLRASVHQ